MKTYKLIEYPSFFKGRNKFIKQSFGLYSKEQAIKAVNEFFRDFSKTLVLKEVNREKPLVVNKPWTSPVPEVSPIYRERHEKFCQLENRGSLKGCLNGRANNKRSSGLYYTEEVTQATQKKNHLGD